MMGSQNHDFGFSERSEESTQAGVREVKEARQDALEQKNSHPHCRIIVGNAFY